MEHLANIGRYILESFLHIWPYLVISIPIAVAVKVSGISKYINRAFSRRPVVSILLASAIGAFSPFCSCGVIPIISSLLIGGVPLAPVMSFWIASPSMDPEIFLLSTATIGLELSTWRLAASLILSVGAGFATQFIYARGWFGKEIIKGAGSSPAGRKRTISLQLLKERVREAVGSGKAPGSVLLQVKPVQDPGTGQAINCCIAAGELRVEEPAEEPKTKPEGGCNGGCNSPEPGLWKKLSKETRIAVLMVSKFMLLAFFINALIHFYLPADFLANTLGGRSTSSVFLATLIGVPVYTSNITALPVISGLLELGMNPGAALAFLISGPITTLPAISAVWGIVNRRVFLVYILTALIGGLFFGLLFNLVY